MRNRARSARACGWPTLRLMRQIALLGSTGSIGRQAIQVCEADPGLGICGLAAGTDVDGVVGEAERLGVRTIALADASAAERPAGGSAGASSPVPRASRSWAPRAADTVLNAVVGAAGLAATLAALGAGIDVALANKESLVAGGPLVRAALARSDATLLPVDSEHSALHQLLAGEDADSRVESLVVTASGGRFRGATAAGSPTSRPSRRSGTRPGRWARASRSIPRRS